MTMFATLAVLWILAGTIALRIARRQSGGLPEFYALKGVIEVLAYGPLGLWAVLAIRAKERAGGEEAPQA